MFINVYSIKTQKNIFCEICNKIFYQKLVTDDLVNRKVNTLIMIFRLLKPKHRFLGYY